MSGKEISEALSDISDEMVEETALTREEKRSRGKMIWFRIAAMAATVAIVLAVALWPRKTEDGYVTAPGILKVYAYEMKGSEIIDITKMEEYKITDDSTSISEAIWCPYMSVTRGVAITPVVEDDSLKDAQITFTVTANYGELYGDFYSKKYAGDKAQASHEEAFLGKQTVIGNGETLYWEGYEILRSDFDSSIRKETVYVDLIIRADENIVGYAIFEMKPWLQEGNLIGFVGHLQHTEFYPKVEGKYQQVTQEYVNQQIALRKG